ncbi:MAG: hypothetical protein AAFO29_13955 [Actinomycetota bacterium]
MIGLGRPRRSIVAAAVVGAVLVASACTGSSSSEQTASRAGESDSGRATGERGDVEVEGEGEGDNPEREDSGDDQDESSSGDSSEDAEPSVLGLHLGYDIPGLDVGDDTELRRIEQETLSSCMAREGFTYVAYVPDPTTLYVPVEEGLDPDSRRFAATYGFGVSTQFYAQRDVGPGLLGHSGDGSGYAFEENPNDVIRAGLTPEELAAYDRAFWGADSPYFLSTAQQDELAASGKLVGRLITSHGCIGEAQRAIDGEAGEVLDVFAIEILTMTERAYSDDRYLEYAATVERCVHDAGYDFYVNQPAWAILAHFDDLVSTVDQLVGGNPFDELTDDDLAELSPQEIDALYDLPRDLGDEARNRLAEVQDLEVATATTVWDCGGSADEERRVINEILAGLQADFIEEHRDELERFRR